MLLLILHSVFFRVIPWLMLLLPSVFFRVIPWLMLMSLLILPSVANASAFTHYPK